MSQPLESDQSKFKEKEPIQQGIKLNFVNPDLWRAYILDPEKRQNVPSIAEVMSGIRQIPLGEFPLDGKLFRSTRFTLVVEPDHDQRGARPTAIIRADIELGKMDSNLKRLQLSRASEKGKVDFDQITRSKNSFTEIPFLEKEGISMAQFSRNTSRIHHADFLNREKHDKSPLVVLQVWDKDAGIGYISISLFSHKYESEWRERAFKLMQKATDGWEVDHDEMDRWQFDVPVGIDVYDGKRFSDAIKFYEEIFSQTMQPLYKAEEVDVPNLLYEIESPMIFEDQKEISYKDIGGQSEAVKRMRARLSSPGMIDTSSVLLFGPPGTGKSSLIQAFAAELNVPLVRKTTLNLPPAAKEEDVINLIASGYLEATAAARASGKNVAVYCLEALEVFLGSNARLHDFLQNIMEDWPLYSDRTEAVVLFMATSNFPEQLHPGVISRFEGINLPLPNRQGRKEILEIHRRKLEKKFGRDVFAEVDFDKVAQKLGNKSGRELARFLSKAYFLWRLASQEKGQIPLTTDFVLSQMSDNNRIGFKIS